MQKIVKRAGVAVWPKLFHNLRATRETELAVSDPMHVVCEWIGNSPKVARESYLRVTDADYSKASASADGTEWSEDGSKVATESGQSQGQMPAIADDGFLLQIVQKALENGQLEQVAATVGKALQNHELTPRGLEPLLPP